MKPDFIAELEVGSALPPLTVPAISRTVLALYCGASGDHNPLHVDIDAARAAGYPDVFAHGMLSMAYMGRLLTSTFAQSAIRSFLVRFTSITHVHDVITCTARVQGRAVANEELLVTLALEAKTNTGRITLQGEATVAAPWKK
jgi:acyl dehydratase